MFARKRQYPATPKGARLLVGALVMLPEDADDEMYETVAKALALRATAARTRASTRSLHHASADMTADAEVWRRWRRKLALQRLRWLVYHGGPLDNNKLPRKAVDVRANML